MIADNDKASLEEAERELKSTGANVLAVEVDVGDLKSVEKLRDAAYDRFGSVDVLHLNAGVGARGGAYTDYANWEHVLRVNLFGVINGIQAFTPRMTKDRTKPGLIVVTGSKQGITQPPGNAAYNVSKSAVKSATEALAHQLRIEKSPISVHLLVPGWVFTKLTRGDRTEKPEGAWYPDQIVDYSLPKFASPENFFVICPDNAVTEQLDLARMKWSMGDLLEPRGALSRWDSEHTPAYEAFIKKETGS